MSDVDSEDEPMSAARPGGFLSSPFRWSLTLPKVAALGAVFGIAVRLLHQLPGSWGLLGNLGGPWLLLAFLLGSLSGTVTEAALIGLVALLSSLGGYYATAAVVGRASEAAPVVGFWVALAALGGPVLAVTGWWWRHSGSTALRTVGLGILGGAVAGEGLALGWANPEQRLWFVLEVLAGFGLVIGFARSNRDRWLSLAVMPATIATGAVVLGLVLLAFKYL